MRLVTMTYAIDVEVEVPDDFPLSAEEIRRIADWKVNDYMDGRYPFSTEMMVGGATRSASRHLEDSLFHHYCRKIEKWFNRASSSDHLGARDRLIASWRERVGYFQAHGARIAVRDEPLEQACERKEREYRKQEEAAQRKGTETNERAM